MPLGADCPIRPTPWVRPGTFGDAPHDLRNPGSSQDWFLVVLVENSIRWLVCLLGNVDLNLLGIGTPWTVHTPVEW